MENWMLVVGFLFALFVIWRFATKKTRPARRGVVVAIPGQAQAQQPQRATFGTVIAVNVICAIGSIAYIAIYASGTRDGWWLFGGLAGLFAFPIMGMKVLEASEPGNRYSLMGSLAALCILGWLLGMPWFAYEIAADLRGG
ncbi:MAG: hypothetical protein AAGI37_09150 [Planctomycetota bacterium]